MEFRKNQQTFHSILIKPNKIKVYLEIVKAAPIRFVTLMNCSVHKNPDANTDAIPKPKKAAHTLKIISKLVSFIKQICNFLRLDFLSLRNKLES